MKLTPLLSPETHGELKGKFSVYARVPPIDILKLDPNVYRVLVGVVELACVGAILLLEPQLQLLATYVLLVNMVGALYTHYMIGDRLQEAGAAIFGLTIVLTRLYVMMYHPAEAKAKLY